MVLAVNVCELVRSSCRQAAESFNWIRIDQAAIDRVADDLADDPTLSAAALATRGRDRNQNVLPDEAEATATLVLSLDAINFGSGYHDIAVSYTHLTLPTTPYV